MLFPYTYVPHQMEKMQEFIDFIFYEVWCKAPLGLAFDPDLFDNSPDLKDIMSEFGFSPKASVTGKNFYQDVKAIYGLFTDLSPLDIDQFKRWYQANNDIEKVCANDPATHVARYADVAVQYPALADSLGKFFKGLYSQELLDLAALRKKIGDVGDHYQSFMKTNKVGKCPFCGINDLLGEYHSKREAYDHYLPKALYPFNSINFRNLVPTCHHCNSSYKTSKDPARTPKDPVRSVSRRTVFYPYTTAPHRIDIHIDLRNLNVDTLKTTDITLTFGPTEVNDQIETWKAVYGIDERYKAKLCEENSGKYWLTQVLEEWHEDGRDPVSFLRTLTRQAAQSPLADDNFLRKPFLDACQRIGLFDACHSLYQSDL